MPVQSYKSVFIEKATQACLKKRNKRKNTFNNSPKKKRKKITVFTARIKKEGFGRRSGQYWLPSESSRAFSVPRPPPLAVPSSIPGAGASFPGARARAVPDGRERKRFI